MLLSCSLVDGIWRIILASDYSSLVSKLNASEAEWLATGAVSHDIKLLALFKFVSVTFIHVRRVCNRAAPAIVRSVEHVIVGAWYVEAPDFIRAVLCNELVVIYSMKRRPLPKKKPAKGLSCHWNHTPSSLLLQILIFRFLACYSCLQEVLFGSVFSSGTQLCQVWSITVSKSGV